MQIKKGTVISLCLLVKLKMNLISFYLILSNFYIMLLQGAHFLLLLPLM